MFFHKYYPLLFIFFLASCNAIEEEVDFSCSTLESEVKKFRQDLFSDNNVDKAFLFYDSITKLNSPCLKGELGIALGFDLGNYYYFQQVLDSAIYHFQNTLALAEANRDNHSLAALKTNIGATYLGMGFTRSAAKYFMEARILMEESSIRDENYWITCVNQAVAHIGQKDYAYAIKLLDEVDTTYSISVKFLHATNRAKLAGLMKNEPLFLKYLRLSESVVDSLPHYKNMYSEVAIEYFLKFNNLESLKSIWPQVRDQYHDSQPYLQLLIQRLSLRVNNELLGGKTELDRLRHLVLNEGDLEDQLSLVNLLIDQSYKLNSDKELIILLKERYNLNEELHQALNLSDLKDFYEFSEINKLERTNQKLTSEKKFLELKHANTKYFISLLALVLLLSIVSIILILVDRSRKNVITKANEALTEERINQAVQRERRLKQRLSFEANRNSSILMKLSKLQILKKQLEDFINDVRSSSSGLTNVQARLKNAEVNLNAFFNNYSDLAVLGMSSNNQTVFKKQIQKHFSSIFSDMEMKVIDLILRGFTSKEISLLMSKSEKTVEYYRRNIRKKLNLNSHDDIKTELESLVSD